MSIVEQNMPGGPALSRNDLRQRVAGQSLFAVLHGLAAQGEFGIDLASRHVHTSPVSASWYSGLLGERRVASFLDRLGPDVTVLHSVPVGSKSSDIDHVVISQAGVFTINSKNHPGQAVWVGGHGMMVGGSKVHHLRNASHEAKRAERMLSLASGLTVPVTAVIALVGVAQFTVRQPPKGNGVDIAVVRDRDLVGFLSGRAVFSTEQVQRIVDVAVLARTWSGTVLREPDVAELVSVFSAFETLPPLSPKPRNAAVAVLRAWLGIAAGSIPLYFGSLALIEVLRAL